MRRKSNVLRSKGCYLVGLKRHSLFKNGFTDELLAEVMELKTLNVVVFPSLLLNMVLNILKEKRLGIFLSILLLPCATQNELTGEDAKTLISNGVICS